MNMIYIISATLYFLLLSPSLFAFDLLARQHIRHKACKRIQMRYGYSNTPSAMTDTINCINCIKPFIISPEIWSICFKNEYDNVLLIKRSLIINHLQPNRNTHLFGHKKDLACRHIGHHIDVLKTVTFIWRTWHTDDWTKWKPLCRQLVQIHFIEWKFLTIMTFQWVMFRQVWQIMSQYWFR